MLYELSIQKLFRRVRVGYIEVAADPLAADETSPGGIE